MSAILNINLRTFSAAPGAGTGGAPISGLGDAYGTLRTTSSGGFGMIGSILRSPITQTIAIGAAAEHAFNRGFVGGMESISPQIQMAQAMNEMKMTFHRMSLNDRYGAQAASYIEAVGRFDRSWETLKMSLLSLLSSPLTATTDLLNDFTDPNPRTTPPWDRIRNWGERAINSFLDMIPGGFGDYRRAQIEAERRRIEANDRADGRRQAAEAEATLRHQLEALDRFGEGPTNNPDVILRALEPEIEPRGIF